MSTVPEKVVGDAGGALEAHKAVVTSRSAETDRFLCSSRNIVSLSWVLIARVPYHVRAPKRELGQRA